MFSARKFGLANPAGEFLNKFTTYLRYTKPRVWALLVYTAAIGSAVAVSTFNAATIALVVLAVSATALGSAGAEALTNYIDRGMDSVMSRTKNRPLPRGEIKGTKAIAFGLILISFSLLILMVFQRFYAAIFMALGISDNVIVYSYLLKRRTPWSIVLGGFSGGFPVLIGWYTVSSQFSLIPWFLFALVVVWIPIHVWSLAFRYAEDYRKAGVPMLPVRYSDNISAWCISGSAIMLSVFSILPYVFGIQPVYYLIFVTVLSVPLLVLSVMFIEHPTKDWSYRLFKYSSPYLAVIFTLFLAFSMF